MNLPVRVFGKRGCVKASRGVFSSMGKSCLIVTGGKSAVLSGALDDVKEKLTEENVSWTVFDKIGPNPLISACYEAGCLARAENCDFIVGIGGGSPLDGAKAAAVYAANPGIKGTDIYTVTERNRALPLILIGTTAGTGSEIGRVAVLTDDATGRKKSISPDDCFARYAFADPGYTESMPYAVTVSTALDALSHALEGYFSVKCGDIPTLFAKRAVPMIYGELKKMSESGALPDSEGRDRLYYGSLYAGVTLSYCGTAFPHPLGYILTENCGVPHGQACAAFLPAFLDRAERFEKEKLDSILEVTGCTLAQLKGVISSLTDVGKIKMTAEEIARHCSRWDASVPKNFTFSPGSYTKEEAQKLITELFA